MADKPKKYKTPLDKHRAFPIVSFRIPREIFKAIQAVAGKGRSVHQWAKDLVLKEVGKDDGTA